jgi:hypothetical protein
VTDLDPEDAKLLTLATATRARVGTNEGAAVRDSDGRTYAAAPVSLPSLTLSALQVAVAMAVSSGATGLEAAAVVGRVEADADGLGAVREFGGRGIPVIVADGAGEIVAKASA